ncbi:hypothetical protein [Paraflavitalea speifideaquila]|uniref:hypothetical protein n=1 Tax=Paraflavitalea speifideaquila TaxID=3076558 RepID=UPI0028EE1011|nr:hypothetical protein [Paraflavitalea speifideiaquila]
MPTTTGFISVISNFPATLQNTSWEFQINSDNIKNKSFKWSTNANLTIPRNKLLKFQNLEKSTYSYLIIGKSINTARAYTSTGVDPTTGKYIFVSVEGNPTFSPDYATDRTYIYNPDIKFYGGLENNIRFNNVELSFLFQYVKQIAPTFFNDVIPGNFNSGYGNQSTSVLDRWQKVGDNSKYQRFSTNSNVGDALSNYRNSNLAIGDASFLRLKNVSLYWTIPKN